MAITSSAKKALRGSRRKAVFNARRRKNVEDVVRRLKKLVADKKKSEALALMPEVYKFIDKAAKSHTLGKNTASRKKSRLAALVNKIS